MVPYASMPYADHILRELEIDPNTKANSDEHIDVLIKAAENLRQLVQSMENLEEIKGFITYSIEEKKEQKKIESEDEEPKEEQKTIQQLKQEVGERIVNA